MVSRAMNQPLQTLSMLRLASAALPIGAFAYSQGLESAIDSGAVRDGPGAEAWIGGVFEHSLLTCDVPLLSAMRRALDDPQVEALVSLDAQWRATRGTRELREEDRQLGAALLRLLTGQLLVPPDSRRRVSAPSFGYAFALAGWCWGIAVEQLAYSYCFSWFEAQLGAATRLVPLGQTEAQAILSRLLEAAANGLESSLELQPGEISSTAPGQVLYSTQHESLYSRLFRS